MRRPEEIDRALLLLLLPCALEALPQRAQAEQLLAAPGVVAVEPPRVPLSPVLARAVAPRQAKRMKLPGVPRAVAVFAAPQLPLAVALLERHAGAELWHLGEGSEHVDFALELAAGTDLRPAWERMEAVGVESGRLGSERAG